jgi:SWI/SNF-related matrix-associated actin-dependent regulator of chromatin subfamily A3
MVSRKRARDPAAESDAPSSKHGCLSRSGTAASSSQSETAYTGNSRSAPASSTSSSQLPASTQVIDDEEDELIGQARDDDDSPLLDLYGTHDAKIVGVRYYNGLVTPHELVVLVREPNNQYDANAIRVNNVMGQQIGHIARKLAEKLAPYLDQEDVVLEGVLTGEKGFYDCPIRLYFYGTGQPAARLALEERLKADKLLKATELKRTRKEAEARKNTGLKSGNTSGSGLGSTAAATALKEEQDASLENLVAASEALETARTDAFADTLAIGEEELKAMAMAEQPDAMKSCMLPYQLQVCWLQKILCLIY